MMTEMLGDLDTERIRAVVTRRDSLNDLDAGEEGSRTAVATFGRQLSAIGLSEDDLLDLAFSLITFRRKNQFLAEPVIVLSRRAGSEAQKTLRTDPQGLEGNSAFMYPGYFAIARPMLMRLSAMMPSPTHRVIPASSL